MPAAQVHTAAAGLGAVPGADPERVRELWRQFLRTARPDLGGVDGATLRQRVADRDLLLSVARPPQPEPEVVEATAATPAAVRVVLADPRLGRAAAAYLSQERSNPAAQGGRVALEM